MGLEARHLQEFAKQIERPDLAGKAAELAAEFDAAGFPEIAKATPQIELPDNIRRFHLQSKPLDRKDFTAAFEEKGIHVPQVIIDRIELTGKPQDEEIIFPRGRDLGLNRRAPYRKFLETGQDVGLHKFHPEVGLYLRLEDTNQPSGVYWLAMEPVRLGRGVDPDVLGLGRSSGGLWLRTSWGNPSDEWDPDDHVAFGVSK